MLPRDLLETAKYLATGNSGKPMQAFLRRAVSTTYYAMFHTLARCCADLMIGSSGANRSDEAWNQVYRSLDHGFAKQACQNQITVSKFPKEIQDFANMFALMQVNRHDADYNPSKKFFKSAVLADIGAVDAVITDFSGAPIRDRRAFAAWVTFKIRK